MTRHFVTFYSPGTFVHEETSKPIHAWDTKKAVEMARGITERHGATPFCFRFSTRHRDNDELDSRVVKNSGRFFLGGNILTLKEIKARKDKDDRILISNMESNGMARVVENNNSWKSVQPLEADDVVLDFTP